MHEHSFPTPKLTNALAELIMLGE